MATFGAKTSKPNIPVDTTTDIRNLQFSSENPAPKIFKIITFSVRIPSGEAGGTVTKKSVKHGFVGGAPAFIPYVMWNDTGNLIQKDISVSGVLFQFDATINSDEVSALIYHGSNAPGSDTYFDFKIYILSDRLA